MGRFSFDCKPKSVNGIFKTKSMRITLLTPCLIRLETGHFTDLPTQTVWNREFPKVPCKTMQNRNIFTIETEEVTFCIDVVKNQMSGIILSDGSFVTEFDSGNLLGTARTLDNINGAVKLNKGIMSRSGVAVMDDSRSLLLSQDGRILPRENCTDLYYFAYGHDYLRCLKDFYRLTGPVPLIPKFVLGNWWSRYRAYTQEEYQDLMQRFIDKKLPITVATIDMDWHWTDVKERFGSDADTGKPRTKEELFYNLNVPGWTGYSWNTELFPDHRALLGWLKAQGFHITMNVHPSQGIRPFEDCYEDACRALGKDPASRERIPFDIADPSFVEAYLDTAHHPHEQDGVDFWWLDWQQGTVTNIPGLDPLWALNHYHTLDAGRENQRPLILSRYAGLGSHRYPIGFSGDSHVTWKSLDFQPYFTNNAANAGYTWWSHDIGGHMMGIQDDELYLRWLQYGVFSPINRLHSSNSDYMGKEPWKRSWAVEKVSEEFFRLRHKLIPYLYSANYQTHRNAVPVCMPLYYRYDQEEAYEIKNSYLFGGQLLVAPITSPADRRLNLASVRVWLPEGRWTDFFTGQIYRGGQFVTMHRDLDSIPVLAGEGTIVPMYQDAQSNSLSLDQPLDIHVWRGNGAFDLYEDDGESNEYLSGHYSIIHMDAAEEESCLRFTIHAAEGDPAVLPETRRMTIRFRDVTDARVCVNGIDSPAIHDGCLCVEVCYENQTVDIVLSDVVCAVNADPAEAKTNLLTRVQGSNHWKSNVFPSWKNKGSYRNVPGYIMEALKEFDAME